MLRFEIFIFARKRRKKFFSNEKVRGEEKERTRRNCIKYYARYTESC